FACRDRATPGRPRRERLPSLPKGLSQASRHLRNFNVNQPANHARLRAGTKCSSTHTRIAKFRFVISSPSLHHGPSNSCGSRRRISSSINGLASPRCIASAASCLSVRVSSRTDSLASRSARRMPTLALMGNLTTVGLFLVMSAFLLSFVEWPDPISAVPIAGLCAFSAKLLYSRLREIDADLSALHMRLMLVVVIQQLVEFGSNTHRVTP